MTELARQPREPIFGGVNTQTIAHQVLCFNKALDVEGWTPGS